MTNNGLSWLKWIAVVSMLFDHINRILFAREIEWMYSFGRLAMPLFVWVFVCNLARPGFFEGAHRRVFKRLLIFAFLSTIPFIGINYVLGEGYQKVFGALPLNILFVLLAVGAAAYFIEKKEYAFLAIVLCLSGFVVEYFWAGVFLGVGFYLLHLRRRLFATMLVVVGAFLLLVINDSIWTLLVIPIILIAPKLPIALPRAKWFFYGFYPAHLTILLVIHLLAPRLGAILQF